jgi:hypothetical protein
MTLYKFGNAHAAAVWVEDPLPSLCHAYILGTFRCSALREALQNTDPGADGGTTAIWWTDTSSARTPRT